MTFILYKPSLVGDLVFWVERLDGVRARHIRNRGGGKSTVNDCSHSVSRKRSSKILRQGPLHIYGYAVVPG